MPRQVLTLDLKDDAVVDRYREYHRRVPIEVLDSLRDAGVIGMQIFLLGRRLVMIVETTEGADLRRAFETRVASHPRVAEWETLMTSLQQRAPGAAEGEWWAAMEPVFDFSGPAPRA